MIIANTHGGIGNRMKCIASSIRISKHKLIPLIIEWGKKEYVMNCEFKNLFDNSFEISNKKINCLKNDLIYPYYPFDCWRLVTISTDLIDNNFTKVKKDIAGIYFKNYDKYDKFIDLEYNRIPKKIKKEYIDIFSIFKPNKDLENIINTYEKNNFNLKTISVHIRTWPVHYKRHKYNNLQNFINFMNKYDDSYKFFVCSDSKCVIDKLKDIFNNRILTFSRKTTLINNKTLQDNRNSINGLRDDLCELYLLSKNKILIGSHTSTFTEVAWYLGGCTNNITII